MNVSVQLFAQARDLVGASTVLLHLPEQSRLPDVKRCLAEQFPALQPLLPSLLVAVDTQYAVDDTVFDERSRIACFPPVSGG